VVCFLHESVYEINQICDERFDRLDDEQAEMAGHLTETTRIVREHSTTLADHSRRLTAIELELRRQGELLLANQTAITQMSATVSAVKESLDKMNGNIMRILYIVIAALIVLAGVTKLGDLGIL
jgi:hypothetical protein